MPTLISVLFPRLVRVSEPGDRSIPGPGFNSIEIPIGVTGVGVDVGVGEGVEVGSSVGVGVGVSGSGVEVAVRVGVGTSVGVGEHAAAARTNIAHVAPRKKEEDDSLDTVTFIAEEMPATFYTSLVARQEIQITKKTASTRIFFELR